MSIMDIFSEVNILSYNIGLCFISLTFLLFTVCLTHSFHLQAYWPFILVDLCFIGESFIQHNIKSNYSQIPLKVDCGLLRCGATQSHLRRYLCFGGAYYLLQGHNPD